MKTAEEMIQEFTVSHAGIKAKDVVAMLMREYANQVADQALTDAAENFKGIIINYGQGSTIDVAVAIRLTAIKTP